MRSSSTARVAVLYQAIEPPRIDAVRKPKKPGGYSDSGADIAFVLRAAGVDVITPHRKPSPTNDLDWVYPDDSEGIARAIGDGANLLWANTVLFDDHPVQHASRSGVRVVGQDPTLVHRFDDKWIARLALLDATLPTVDAVLATASDEANKEHGAILLSELDAERLAVHGIVPPFVVKPVRGRGSEAVSKVDSVEELHTALQGMFDATTSDGGSRYGRKAMVESYLAGNEITVTVMPPGNYFFGERSVRHDAHWSLPAVERWSHENGIAPYNGVVAVTQNSKVVRDENAYIASARRSCERAGTLLDSRMPIRIDCRADSTGRYRLFDVNLKPNMTGPGRPGRDDQDSLTLIAARAVGWSYEELLINVFCACVAALPPFPTGSASRPGARD